ncbi:MAG: CAP domain-containing protein [Lactobacillaceae bacterium]|jgi:uncharacterized protein YkwD|nr:CAP domain-containing protein [Lactobacillaceae bacterium]
MKILNTILLLPTTITSLALGNVHNSNQIVDSESNKVLNVNPDSLLNNGTTKVKHKIYNNQPVQLLATAKVEKEGKTVERVMIQQNKQNPTWVDKDQVNDFAKVQKTDSKDYKAFITANDDKFYGLFENAPQNTSKDSLKESLNTKDLNEKPIQVKAESEVKNPDGTITTYAQINLDNQNYWVNKNAITTTDLAAKRANDEQIAAQGGQAVVDTLNYWNQLRAKLGLNPVKVNTSINAIATQRALAIGSSSNWFATHEASSMLEVVANGFAPGQSVIDAWYYEIGMVNGGHTEFLINPNITEVGIGFANGWTVVDAR